MERKKRYEKKTMKGKEKKTMKGKRKNGGPRGVPLCAAMVHVQYASGLLQNFFGAFSNTE